MIADWCWLLATFFICFLFWRGIFSICDRVPRIATWPAYGVFEGLPANTQLEWKSRLVSNLHSLVAMVGGLSVCLETGAFASPLDATFGMRPSRSCFLVVTCAYLFYDLLLCLQHRLALGDPLTLVHHVLILVAFATGLLTGIGTFYMGCFLMNEISTFFLNVNFFLACHPPWHESLAYKLNAVALWTSFLVSRVIYNWYLAYHIVVHAWLPLSHLLEPGVTPVWVVVLCFILSVLAFLHCLLNMVWFTVLTKAVLRKISRTTKDKHS